MMRTHRFILLAALWLCVMPVLRAQANRDAARLQETFSAGAITQRLQQDIERLASDDMEGRESGTRGEELAAGFIKERMIEIGLSPVFGDSFFQVFPFPGEWDWGEANRLRIGSREFEHGEDFYTMPGSGNQRVEAALVYVGSFVQGDAQLEAAGGLAQLAGKIIVIDYYLSEDWENTAFSGFRELNAYRFSLADSLGVAGVMLVNTDSVRTDPRTDVRISMQTLDFPVVFARRQVFEHLTAGGYAEALLETDLHRHERQSLNVAGYLDNGAEHTVVIGGHFDHLGFGGRGSRSPGLVAIHPGADDNASGIAGMLEAAAWLQHAGLTGNNYLFIAFGAEEKGLVGSRYFVDSEAYPLKRINYMFNLDMIGRVTDERLSLIGTGSSPRWDSLIDGLNPEGLQLRKSPGGTGGSDHAPFYMRQIPVIFFFSGTHDDYHQPGDTPDKINYDGMLRVLDLMYEMIGILDGEAKLEFSTAPVVERGRRRAETPALGLMPDHTYEGDGLKVQAVMEDRPAQRAGLLAGDVIIRIGEKDVMEIHTYMEALGQLSAGQQVPLIIKRGEEELHIKVQL